MRERALSERVSQSIARSDRIGPSGKTTLKGLIWSAFFSTR